MWNGNAAAALNGALTIAIEPQQEDQVKVKLPKTAATSHVHII
jgi:hypothetical protein